MFCPQIAEHFGRPLRLKKCLYGADFSDKSWYDTLDNFLQKDMGAVGPVVIPQLIKSIPII